MPSHASFTDREDLRGRAYADERHLLTRKSIYRYRRPRLDLVSEVMSRLVGAPDGTAVDVGCGDGAYTRALRRLRPRQRGLAVDLSSGMARAAGAPAVVADAARLPLPDGSCAAALALHMLYHVPDPDAAVAELARVCRPGARVVIAGNAADDKAEFDGLWARAAGSVPGAAAGFRRDEFLTLDEMESLARKHFPRVEREDFVGVTAVPGAAPLIDYLASTRALRGVDDATFDAVLAEAADEVAATVARAGCFAFTNHIGLVTAQA